MKHHRYLLGLRGLFRKDIQPLQWGQLRCAPFLSRRAVKFSQMQLRPFNTIQNADLEDDEQLEQENIVQDVLLYNRQFGYSQQKNVVVIMPRQKIGADKKTKERAQFLLEETITLAESNTGWKVVGNHMISTASITSKVIFGKTNLGYLKEYVQSVNANAVIFALHSFTPRQHHFFSEFLNVDVSNSSRIDNLYLKIFFTRFMIVF